MSNLDENNRERGLGLMVGLKYAIVLVLFLWLLIMAVVGSCYSRIRPMPKAETEVKQ